MEIIKHSSLELNWLSRQSKQITIPKVVYIDQNGGFYIKPQYQPYIYAGKEVLAHKGILFVGDHSHYKSILAHEWRHHWQKMNGWDNKYKHFDYDFSYGKYKREIIRFFIDVFRM